MSQPSVTSHSPPTTHMDDDISTAQDFPVSFAIFALARSHRAVAAGLLAEIGMFPGQELVLMKLWDKEGQSQKEIVDALGLDHSTVAKSLRRLENAGFVSRAKSAADGRMTIVHLTDSGRAARERIQVIWASLERQTVTGLSPAEQEQFVALARKISPNIN